MSITPTTRESKYAIGLADPASGGVPGSPVTHALTPANWTLGYSSSRASTGEIYQHRGSSASAQSDRAASLTFNYGLRAPSANSLWRKILQSAMFCTPVDIDLSGTTFAVTGQQITDTANGFTAIDVGHTIRIKNTTVVGSGNVTVTAKANDGDITVSGALPVVTLGDSVTIKSTVFRDGAVCHPLMAEESDGTTNGFRRALGLYFDSLTLPLHKDNIIAQLSMKGTTYATKQGSIVAPTADPNDPVWKFSDGAEDFPLALTYPELTLKIGNGLEAVDNCKKANPEKYSPGEFMPEISGRAIYDLNGVHEEAHNDTRRDFSFSIQRPDGESLYFAFKDGIYTQTDSPHEGPGKTRSETFTLKFEGQPGNQPYRMQVCYLPA